VRRRQRTEGPSVEAPPEGNDLMLLRTAALPGPATRELEGPFVRFRARVAEEDAVREGVLDQPRSELGRRRGAEQIRRVDDARLQRAAHRLGEVRVAIAQRVYGDPRRKIEIAR